MLHWTKSVRIKKGGEIIRIRRRRPVSPQRKEETILINEQITAPLVRLIDNAGALVGVVTREEALKRAEEAELDVVLISPKVEPPVCKLVEYDKFRYQQLKKQQKNEKKQKKVELKEIRLRPKIGKNDLEIKIRKARAFLEEGNKVKFSLQLVGREALHLETSMQTMHVAIEALSDIASLEEEPKKFDRRSVSATLIPTKK